MYRNLPVIPAHRGQHFLADWVQSVRAQQGWFQHPSTAPCSTQPDLPKSVARRNMTAWSMNIELSCSYSGDNDPCVAIGIYIVQISLVTISQNQWTDFIMKAVGEDVCMTCICHHLTSFTRSFSSSSCSFDQSSVAPKVPTQSSKSLSLSSNTSEGYSEAALSKDCNNQYLYLSLIVH